MLVESIFHNKSSAVVTIISDASIADAVDLLVQHRIGALVVCSGPESIDGMLSERDIVRSLSTPDNKTLSLPVHQLMSTEVYTCSMNTSVSELMSLMTNKRIRHVPVVANGKLEGIVSIGDIVHARVNELVSERKEIQNYITS